MMKLDFFLKRLRTLITFFTILACLCVEAQYCYSSYDNAKIISLDFKMPPYYDKERKEIMEVTKKKEPNHLKRWSKIKNFNFDVLAIADLDSDGKPDVAYVLLEITKSDDGFLNAAFAKYVKHKNEWVFSTEEASTGDMYYIIGKKGKPRLVTDGCVMKSDMKEIEYYFGDFKSRTRDGKWLPYFMSARNAKLESIVKRELKSEIAEEIRNYKENYKGEPEVLSISGVFKDITGDGRADIIVRMNDIFRGPGTANPQPPFCDDDSCDYYILINKGDDRWQKELIGRTSCIGLSKPDNKGIMQIYTDQTTLIWIGGKYKKVQYKPNWMLKAPIKIGEGL